LDGRWLHRYSRGVSRLAAGLLWIVGCKGAPAGAVPADAGPADAALAEAGPADAAPPSATASSAEAGAEAGAIPDGGIDADAEARPEGELTLDVQGAYCGADSANEPGCRSYTLVLRRTDGKLRGGRRRSAVPLDEVDQLFDLAEQAFDAKHSCIPNGPDMGGQAIKLRRNGKTQTASGGCGKRFDEVTKRLEKLAAAR